MIEVEIKVPIFKRSITERLLRENHFTPGHLVKETDLYFSGQIHDFMKSDEALRLRSREDMTTTSSQTILTYKGPKLDDISMSRKEIETQVENFENCKEILISLGYDQVYRVTKLRQHYHFNEITACVDQVEQLGAFLELEILISSIEQKADALKKIETVLERLDLCMKDTTRYSYLYMLQKRQGLC